MKNVVANATILPDINNKAGLNVDCIAAKIILRKNPGRAVREQVDWAEVAENKLDMDCTYEEGKLSDLVSFKRPGASGELKVTKDRFEDALRPLL